MNSFLQNFQQVEKGGKGGTVEREKEQNLVKVEGEEERAERLGRDGEKKKRQMR